MGGKFRIAVFHVTGWWRLRPHLKRYEDRICYSLGVSLRAPGQAVDLYQPIIQQITAPIPVQITAT